MPDITYSPGTGVMRDVQEQLIEAWRHLNAASKAADEAENVTERTSDTQRRIADIQAAIEGVLGYTMGLDMAYALEQLKPEEY